jgi:hypothetical protein
VIYFGIAGAALGCFRLLFTPKHKWWPAYLLLIIWAAILFVGSRIGALAYPVRFARDLAVPLALLGGAFVGDVSSLSKHVRLNQIMAGMLLILLFGVGYRTFMIRYRGVLEPDRLVHHLKVDQEAADYISQNLPNDAHIIVFQESLYVDLFTPHTTVTWLIGPTERHYLFAEDHPERTLKDTDYLYLEERLDIPQTDENNASLIEYYTHSPLLDVVTSFQQPEKVVYLLKVNHAAVNKKLAEE